MNLSDMIPDSVIEELEKIGKITVGSAGNIHIPDPTDGMAWHIEGDKLTVGLKIDYSRQIKTS